MSRIWSVQEARSVRITGRAVRRGWARFGLGSVALAILAGCAGSSDEIAPEEPGTGPAVLVGVFVQNPEGRNIYVGSVPELPEGELDYSKFLEFSNVDVSTFGGWVFVQNREDATLTRFSVREDQSLYQDGPRLSFLAYSAAHEYDADLITFISSTRAYLLPTELDEVVVFNPSTMEVTGTIPMEVPDVPARFTSWAQNPAVVGDRVVWEIVSVDEEAEELHHSVTLAIASTETDEPVIHVTDDRCAGVNGGHMDDEGDYYVRADGYWGYYAA